MKLVVAVIQEDDVSSVGQALMDAGFRVTKIASTGGFFRRGSATLLIGVEDDQVDRVIQLLREYCGQPAEPAFKQGVVFVLPVDRFEQL